MFRGIGGIKNKNVFCRQNTNIRLSKMQTSYHVSMAPLPISPKQHIIVTTEQLF